jgi:hypothetical protein
MYSLALVVVELVDCVLAPCVAQQGVESHAERGCHMWAVQFGGLTGERRPLLCCVSSPLSLVLDDDAVASKGSLSERILMLPGSPGSIGLARLQRVERNPNLVHWSGSSSSGLRLGLLKQSV